MKKVIIATVLLVIGMINVPAAQVTYWKPAQVTTWQWQLQGTIDQTKNVTMFDVDGFDVSASTVASLHAKGKKVVCYISAGTYENWRPDASKFPASVKGRRNGWPGEQWLDIRQISILGPIMTARMDMCKSKGFDGLEPDNIDGAFNNTGFSLTGANQITYNRFLATEAHKRGLSIGLKNDVDQTSQLVGNFDFAINEECFDYDECDTLTPFILAGKAVFVAEYSLSLSQFCPQAVAMRFNGIKKSYDLDAPLSVCPSPTP